jgi:hypothetical protein
MKKIIVVVFLLALAIAGSCWFLHHRHRQINPSTAAMVQKIDELQNQKTNFLSMAWYEQEVLRRRLVTKGYLVNKVFDMPNTRMETPEAKEIWNALLTFRDKECSTVANFGVGPADASTNIMYVTVTDLPSRIPKWVEMLRKWDEGVKETTDRAKPGPESRPTS